MSQQWAIPVRVCVHGADSICRGTHQIVRRSGVSTLGTYDLPFTHIQYHFLYARVICKNTQLLEAYNKNPFSKLPKMRQFPKWNWISLYKIGQQTIPQLQFWLTDLRHMEMIPHALSLHQYSYRCSHYFSLFLIETAALCEHPLNDAGQTHAASTKIPIQDFQKHLHLTCLYFLLKSMTNLLVRTSVVSFVGVLDFLLVLVGVFLPFFWGFVAFLIIKWKKP